MSLCPKFDRGDTASLSFSYGEFPNMKPLEEYRVEICLNDRHGPVGQKCHMQLPCEVHHVHVGKVSGEAADIIGELRSIVNKFMNQFYGHMQPLQMEEA